MPEAKKKKPYSMVEYMKATLQGPDVWNTPNAIQKQMDKNREDAEFEEKMKAARRKVDQQRRVKGKGG